MCGVRGVRDARIVHDDVVAADARRGEPSSSKLLEAVLTRAHPAHEDALEEAVITRRSELLHAPLDRGRKVGADRADRPARRPLERTVVAHPPSSSRGLSRTALR